MTRAVLLPFAALALLAACASAKESTGETVTAHGTSTTTTHTPGTADEQATHDRGCSAGDLPACHAAALDRYYAPPSAESDGESLRLFRKACDGGYSASCNGVGVMYAEGRGVPKDERAAMTWWQKACAGDGSTGCEHLASALEAGRGTPKDAALARDVRARGECLFQASLAKDAGAPCAPLPQLP